MVDIDRVRKGDILITEEPMFGQLRLLYGPVVLIDDERKEVAIELGEERRSFPTAKLWTIPAFMARKATVQQKIVINSGTRVLAGFIATLLEGGVDQRNFNDILGEIRKRGIRPARIQEVLEVLMNM